MTVQEIRNQVWELLSSPHLTREYMTGISYDELSKLRTFIKSPPDDHVADANETASEITKYVIILETHDGVIHVLDIKKLVSAPKDNLLMIHVEDFRNKGK